VDDRITTERESTSRAVRRLVATARPAGSTVRRTRGACSSGWA